ncbi:MAG: glutathione S-transferase N-terminal domain-containing protein [Myxococcales bacterium]|nr:glutathione S-transferase N-terminal domain-containing protein [Myxococcales bacterium]MBK7195281.1 glutathione S-transferase N-terminal domain-containing protein [Myxococcales bacterium]MBP6845466.1 glutathione S-transferase N-terminal domain-containing protein [Kofleriaceae bacterium]
MPARLVTIPFSHYCEKARWALARAGVDFVEDGHLPIYAYLALRRAGAGRTVPALITSDGAVVADSTDILRWCDAHGRAAPLAPADLPAAAELEDDFDLHLGPAARRLGYFHLLPSKRGFAELLARGGVPGWQARSGRLARPVVVRLIKRGLRIDAAGAARSRVVVDEAFAKVGALLADGRRYLCGDRFTAADLTFAALAAPVLMPDAYATAYMPSPANQPPSFRALVDELRATPAGAFGLRIYAEHR